MKKVLSAFVGMSLLFSGISVKDLIVPSHKVVAAESKEEIIPWDHKVHSIKSLYNNFYLHMHNGDPSYRPEKLVYAKADLYNEGTLPGYEDWQWHDEDWNMYYHNSAKYGVHERMAHRNFKTRTANIYVKDKSLLPAVKSAIKIWQPAFKFKLVNSMKHANFYSKKYANIIICDDPYKNSYSETGPSIIENKTKEERKLNNNNKYQFSWESHITKKDRSYIKKHPNSIIDGTFDGKHKKVNGKVWFMTRDGKKYLDDYVQNIVLHTKNMSKQRKINEIAAQLGITIGLGANTTYDEENYNSTDISTFYDVKDDVPKKKLEVKFHVTQLDLNHLDWIYAHPYDKEVNFDWGEVQ